MDNTARERGWSETNMPTCVGCRNPISVRGDADVAVLPGKILECKSPDVNWIAHFNCRNADWWHATKTDQWNVRKMGDRVYTLTAHSRHRAWDDPQVKYCRTQGL